MLLLQRLGNYNLSRRGAPNYIIMIILGFVKTGQREQMYGWQKQTVAQEHKGDNKLLYCGGL
jgi:hypothetical protein